VSSVAVMAGVAAAGATSPQPAFDASRDRFEGVVGWLVS